MGKTGEYLVYNFAEICPIKGKDTKKVWKKQKIFPISQEKISQNVRTKSVIFLRVTA